MSQMKRWPFGGRKGSFNLSWFHRFEYIKLGGYPKAFQSSTAIFACNLVGKKCLDALFEVPYSSRESTTLADCWWHSRFFVVDQYIIISNLETLVHVIECLKFLRAFDVCVGQHPKHAFQRSKISTGRR